MFWYVLVCWTLTLTLEYFHLVLTLRMLWLREKGTWISWDHTIAGNQYLNNNLILHIRGNRKVSYIRIPLSFKIDFDPQIKFPCLLFIAACYYFALFYWFLPIVYLRCSGWEIPWSTFTIQPGEGIVPGYSILAIWLCVHAQEPVVLVKGMLSTFWMKYT